MGQWIKGSDVEGNANEQTELDAVNYFTSQPPQIGWFS